ncbi:hypothetical protein TNCV_1272421 [Trichonephila clavipes]|nr:hypothetical protein TNCV_1272421 [Trichonephila clavipes]
MNGGHGQRNIMTLFLLTNPASACNITMVGFEFGDTVDKAQLHVSRSVQEFFLMHHIKLLSSPACSFDPSPIENVWSLFAQQMAGIHQPLLNHINFSNMWKPLGDCWIPKDTSKASLILWRGVFQQL